MRTTGRNGAGRIPPAQTRLRRTPKPADDMGVAQTEDVARYIADMLEQLSSMASGADLDLLAYFLKMAHAECLSHYRHPVDAAND